MQFRLLNSTIQIHKRNPSKQTNKQTTNNNKIWNSWIAFCVDHSIYKNHLLRFYFFTLIHIFSVSFSVFLCLWIIFRHFFFGLSLDVFRRLIIYVKYVFWCFPIPFQLHRHLFVTIKPQLRSLPLFLSLSDLYHLRIFSCCFLFSLIFNLFLLVNQIVWVKKRVANEWSRLNSIQFDNSMKKIKKKKTINKNEWFYVCGNSFHQKLVL